MPPRQKKAAREGRPAPPPAPVRRFTRRRIFLLVGALIAIEAVVWAILWRRTHPPAAVSATEPTAQAATALSREDFIALAERVKSLEDDGRFAESLPGARMLIEQHRLRDRLAASMLVDYARMLNNAAFEGGTRAPRSSFERIAFEQQALRVTQAALAMAETPRERAEAITFVGLVHEAWGFPYDAVVTYRAARETDPTYTEARKRYDLFVSRLVPVAASGAP